MRGRFIQTLTEKNIAFQSMTGLGYYRAAKDDNGLKKKIDLKNRKYISLLFYYCSDNCVSLVLLLA